MNYAEQGSEVGTGSGYQAAVLAKIVDSVFTIEILPDLARSAAAEDIPGPLVDQLRDGGVMVIPVGPTESVQALTLVKKEGNNVVTQSLVPVRFVPLRRKR